MMSTNHNARTSQSTSGHSHSGHSHSGQSHANRSHSGPAPTGPSDERSAPAERAKAHPVHEVRFGRIVAAVWENRSEQGGIRHNVTVTRIYRLQDQWRETQSFGRDDLLLVAKVLDCCHTWIHQHASSD